jgi:glycosyltransferase involved in cell wall biosynthesis
MKPLDPLTVGPGSFGEKTNSPLVTCLCLTTAGRKEFLNRAVECFMAQRYENCELLIVADSVFDLDIELRPVGTAPCDRPLTVGQDVSVLIPFRALTIGAKRNAGCEAAQGEIIAVWDDDDYSAPGRIEFQVQSLRIAQKAVTGFQVMKFTDGASWWQYALPAGFVIGTSLCFRRDWWEKHPFEDRQIGEDVRFADVAYQAGQLAMCPDMDLMYATIHPGNTSIKKPGSDPGWTELPGFKWAK